MHHAFENTASDCTLATRISHLRPRIARPFESLMDACLVLRGASPALATALSRLMALSQQADALDQRLDHLGQICGRARGLPVGARESAQGLVLHHLMALAEILADAERVVTDARDRIAAALAPDGEGTALAPLDLIMGELQGLAAELEALADAHRAPAPAEGPEPACLDWATGLYTMEAERAAHRRFVAGATGARA